MVSPPARVGDLDQQRIAGAPSPECAWPRGPGAAAWSTHDRLCSARPRSAPALDVTRHEQGSPCPPMGPGLRSTAPPRRGPRPRPQRPRARRLSSVCSGKVPSSVRRSQRRKPRRRSSLRETPQAHGEQKRPNGAGRLAQSVHAPEEARNTSCTGRLVEPRAPPSAAGILARPVRTVATRPMRGVALAPDQAPAARAASGDSAATSPSSVASFATALRHRSPRWARPPRNSTKGQRAATPVIPHPRRVRVIQVPDQIRELERRQLRRLAVRCAATRRCWLTVLQRRRRTRRA